MVDEEVQVLLRAAYARAKDILQTNLEALHQIAARLIEKETIEGGAA